MMTDRQTIQAGQKWCRYGKKLNFGIMSKVSILRFQILFVLSISIWYPIEALTTKNILHLKCHHPKFHFQLEGNNENLKRNRSLLDKQKDTFHGLHHNMLPTSEKDGERENGIWFKLKKVYTSYIGLLERKPLTTNCIASGVISAVGDILSQYIELRNQTFNFDPCRFAAFFISGTIFVGPFMHFWYGYLWRFGRFLKRKYNSSKQIQSMTQNVIDQTVGVTLFFPIFFYIYELFYALCSFKAPSFAIATSNLQNELKSVIIMQYKVWIVVNWINFTYVPEILRVLVSNIVAVFWNAYLSMRMA